MGKRSTTSTKSGRAMNPADQARKEARRRELKKNKKQRQVVREAVIKSKDPKKVIEELIRLDEMEYNINEVPPLPDHVLLERRKRLLGNFNRCLSLYDKEDKTQYTELKKLLAAYHRKHEEIRKYYDSVKKAQNVTIEDIALPMAPPEEDAPVPVETVAPVRFPLGPVVISAPRLLTWEAFSDDLSDTSGRQPPGPPCCPPPTLSDDSDEEGDIVVKSHAEEVETDEDDEEEEEEDETDRKSKNRKEEADISFDEKDLAEPTESLSLDPVQPEIPPSRSEPGMMQPPIRIRPPALNRPPPFIPPGTPNFRTVPPPSLANMRFAPPPKPVANPVLTRMMMMPPPNFPHGFPSIGPVRTPSVTADTISQRPSLYPQPTPEPKSTIVAKPQLRNSMAEVTRLVPTSVKVKREEQIKPKPKPVGVLGPNVELIPHRPASTQQQPSRPGGADQAYDDFMKEMQGLL